MSNRASLAAVALALVVTAAHAQQLRIVVRDSASRAPVSGAVIQLLSARDSTIALLVSGLGGAAAIEVDSGAAAVRRVRVSKIGFRPASMLVRALGDTVDISLVHLPVRLEPVRVMAAGSCPHDDDARRAAALWAETRPGLIAVLATREEHPANTNLLRYTRDGKTTLEWVRQVVNVSSASQSFATARAQLELFLARVVPGGYALPDEDLLLNESFVNMHCFRTLRGEREHAHDAGIAFEPPPGAAEPMDVKGVLWIEAAGGPPRSLEFRYTSPIVAMRDTAGGLATFENVEGGVSTVTRWWLGVPPWPAPVPMWVTSGPLQRRTTHVVMVQSSSIKESRRFPADVITEVAEVALARWDTTTTWIGTISSVTGTVVSRETRLPLGGVPVILTTLVDPPYTVVTDSSGRFELRNVFERPYMLKAADTTLADYRPEYFVPATRFTGVQAPRSLISLAPPTDATPIQVDRGVSPAITIEIPSVVQAFRNACGRSAAGDAVGIVAGRVSSAWDAPAGTPPAAVTARWPGDRGVVVRETRADSLGFFRFCGVPRGRSIVLMAARGSALSAEIPLVTRDQVLTPVSITLPAPAVRPRP